VVRNLHFCSSKIFFTVRGRFPHLISFLKGYRPLLAPERFMGVRVALGRPRRGRARVAAASQREGARDGRREVHRSVCHPHLISFPKGYRPLLAPERFTGVRVTLGRPRSGRARVAAASRREGARDGWREVHRSICHIGVPDRCNLVEYGPLRVLIVCGWMVVGAMPWERGGRSLP
jgi:hypothetical protein